MPTKERSKDEFFQKIFNALQDVLPINAQTAAEAVFGTLSRHVTEGEIEGVKASPAGGYPRGLASIGASSPSPGVAPGSLGDGIGIPAFSAGSIALSGYVLDAWRRAFGNWNSLPLESLSRRPLKL